MKILKTILNCAFWLLIIALMVAPLGLIYRISDDEMQRYTTPDPPVLRESGWGKIVPAERTDMQEYTILTGSFTSQTYGYMELDKKTAGSIRWLVNVGDEIQEGQVIGSCNGAEICSTMTGILAEMNTYASSPYLRFRLFEPVEFSCRLPDSTLTLLRRSTGLTTEEGEAVTLSYVSRQKNQDGTTDVRLSIDSDRFTFGQEMDGLRIYTGTVYRKTLVLPVKCVYQKTEGEGSPWFVRQVTPDGEFMKEVEVKIGYSDGEYVCVTGINEGEYFDDGYKVTSGG